MSVTIIDLSTHRTILPMDSRDHTTDTIAADLRALARTTAQHLPGLGDVPHPHAPRHLPRRWLIASATVAALVALVPFSYPRLGGYDVVLAVTGSMAPDARSEIARGFATAFETSPAAIDESAASTTFRVRTSQRSRRALRTAAQSFAARLQTRGIDARTSVSPWTTTVSGNAYAFASGRIRKLLIEVHGRDNAAIERDLRSRLEAIGFRDADVTVRHDGARTSIVMRATDAQGRVQSTEFVNERRRNGAPDESPVEIELPDLTDLESLPLDQRRDAVERRLRDAGIDARVTIVNGALRIDANRKTTTH